MQLKFIKFYFISHLKIIDIVIIQLWIPQIILLFWINNLFKLGLSDLIFLMELIHINLNNYWNIFLKKIYLPPLPPLSLRIFYSLKENEFPLYNWRWFIKKKRKLSSKYFKLFSYCYLQVCGNWYPCVERLLQIIFYYFINFLNVIYAVF